MDELVLYTNPMSRGRIARWMLEEVGAPYRTEIVTFGAPMKDGPFRAINPMGKVPALRHGGQVVTETAAICAYLADAFPAAGLAPPPGSPLRAPYYRWLFFGAGPLESAIFNAAMKLDIPAAREAMSGYGNMVLTLDSLEQAIAGRSCLVGDRFSAADVYLGSQIGFGLQFQAIENRPKLAAYFAVIADRPAAIRARAIDDALIPAAPEV